ncbi:MAG: CHY zinc finger protein [Ferruginibacter sp.]|nr:CHY zinc finger protein [Ferruginibacter sp.]
MIEVKGISVDPETRCAHYHSPVDIIAIRFRCCNEYYACYYCHEECAGHAAQPWPASAYGTAAILCGKCRKETSITDYLQGKYTCPHCQAAFNPKCKNHNHLYFSEKSSQDLEQ